MKGSEGKVYRWLGTHTDITEQKDLEEQLDRLVKQRTGELQRSNDDLQQFAHVASHDLKEPVRKIITFGNRLNFEFGTLLLEKGRLYLQKMELAALHMYKMIDGILHYSSFNAMELVKEDIDLNELFGQITADLEILIEEKKARLIIDNLPHILGSPVLIYQLFYNLLNNALKFSSKYRDPVIEVFSKPGADSNFVQLILKDNGIGFRPEQAEKIFQTFSRLHPRDKYEGTGMGLALCRKIVERHQGSIKASGSEDGGATFFIQLPIA